MVLWPSTLCTGELAVCVCVWGGGGGGGGGGGRDKGESEKNTLAHFTLLYTSYTIHRSNKLEYKL